VALPILVGDVRLAQDPQASTQARQRVVDLMGHARSQATGRGELLGAHEGLAGLGELGGHGVERRGQFAHLVGRAHGNPAREVAVADPGGQGGHLPQRFGDEAAHHEGQPDARQGENDEQQGQVGRDPARAVAHRLLVDPRVDEPHLGIDQDRPQVEDVASAVAHEGAGLPFVGLSVGDLEDRRDVVGELSAEARGDHLVVLVDHDEVLQQGVPTGGLVQEQL